MKLPLRPSLTLVKWREMNRMALKIIIADDSAIFRSGIKQILSEEFASVEVVHGAPQSSALDWASGPCDLIFVAVDLARPEKLHFVAELNRAYPNQRVIVLASRAVIPHLEQVLKGYTWRLIAIDGTKEELITAVQDTIASAEQAALENPAIRPLPGPATPPNGKLSNREREVLVLVAAGMSIKEAAAALNVSASTVSTYRVRMLRKLRLKSTAELIRYALENRLAD